MHHLVLFLIEILYLCDAILCKRGSYTKMAPQGVLQPNNQASTLTSLSNHLASLRRHL